MLLPREQVRAGMCMSWTWCAVAEHTVQEPHGELCLGTVLSPPARLVRKGGLWSDQSPPFLPCCALSLYYALPMLYRAAPFSPLMHAVAPPSL